MSKYNNRKTKIDGIVFDSKAEALRYLELKDKEKRGKISDLHLQPKFTLQDGFTDLEGTRHRPITYIADFEYVELGTLVVEDVKGRQTEVYRLKKKLFIKKYPQLIFKEIPASDYV